MKSLKLVTSILMCLSNLCQIGAGSIDVNYEELTELNVTCSPVDTCSTPEPRSSNSLIDNECSCDIFCTRYDTCCVDSPYKNMPKPSITATCRRVDVPTTVYGYFIIDQCPQNEDFQSAYEDLCRNEWNGENDIMRLVPVTSLFTHITYKNYFCFKCHEANDDFVFWIVRTEYEGQSPVEKNTHVQLEFDKHRNSWVAPIGKTGAFIPLSFPVFDVPSDIHSVPETCRLDVISKCSEYWEDDTVRAKCDAYMAVTIINRGGLNFENRNPHNREGFNYRNPHCAICNFEDLNNFMCRPPPPTFGVAFSPPRSYALLLDVNPSDGDKVGKIKKCGNNETWDPYFKKCRPLTCALPGYVVKDGKCTAP